MSAFTTALSHATPKWAITPSGACAILRSTASSSIIGRPSSSRIPSYRPRRDFHDSSVFRSPDVTSGSNTGPPTASPVPPASKPAGSASNTKPKRQQESLNIPSSSKGDIHWLKAEQNGLNARARRFARHKASKAAKSAIKVKPKVAVTVTNVPATTSAGPRVKGQVEVRGEGVLSKNQRRRRARKARERAKAGPATDGGASEFSSAEGVSKAQESGLSSGSNEHESAATAGERITDSGSGAELAVEDEDRDKSGEDVKVEDVAASITITNTNTNTNTNTITDESCSSETGWVVDRRKRKALRGTPPHLETESKDEKPKSNNKMAEKEGNGAGGKEGKRESEREREREMGKSSRRIERGDIITSGVLNAHDIALEKIKPQRTMRIATLRKDLERVLFSPGIHHLRDPRCGVRNFGKSLDEIPLAEEFDFMRTPQYIPPSKDQELLDLASSSGARFFGSTSTLTKALSQIWFTLSGGRQIDLSKLSAEFGSKRSSYTAGAELPAAIRLTRLGQSGVWAVDQDKSWDIPNALSDYGRVLEKQLTAEKDDFLRFLRSAPEEAVPREEREEKEAYRYRKVGSILMRSQLDCHDPRLPGTGVFDIKTRACFPLRHDRANVEFNRDYDVYKEKGSGPTFEREMYDLIRSAMLKFCFQVRIGDMDGIFLAYHNTARIFGFQYLPLSEMDEFLFGSSELADQAFKLSVTLFERIIEHITTSLPEQDSISVVLYHKPGRKFDMNVYYGPAGRKVATSGLKVELENEVDGQVLKGSIALGENERQSIWKTSYTLSTLLPIDVASGYLSAIKQLENMTTQAVPEGRTVEEMVAISLSREVVSEDASEGGSGRGSESDSESENGSGSAIGVTSGEGAKIRTTWLKPENYIKRIREEVRVSKREYEERISVWKEEKGLVGDE